MHKYFLIGLSISSLLFFATLFGVSHLFSQPTQDPEELAYYRAIYVLQQKDVFAAAEKVEVPARVKRHDTTESFLHHDDQEVVMQWLVADLERLTINHPMASLFCAYAYRSLGEHGKAAVLLNSYVAEAPYQEAQYQALCDSLHQVGDYKQLYLMTKEWEEKDSRCLESRAFFMWEALFRLQRYTEASRVALAEEGCLGWRAFIYAGKAFFASAMDAEPIIQEGIKRYPSERLQIEALWEREKSKCSF